MESGQREFPHGLLVFCPFAAGLHEMKKPGSLEFDPG